MPNQIINGWFIQPTVFADVDNGGFLAQQEVFGPVLSILKFSTEQKAVHMANGKEGGREGIYEFIREKSIFISNGGTLI